MQTLNLDKLPPLARAELVDFYEFLLKKYAPSEVAQGRAEMESRWKKVAERVHHDTRYPGGWSDPLKQEMRSFRESAAVEKMSTAPRIGVAKGKFEVPDDIDISNEEVARLFLGETRP